jgi:hypothetical protein
MIRLDPLVTLLQHGTSEQKQQALQDLALWGSEAIEPLIQAVLQADDQEINDILQSLSSSLCKWSPTCGYIGSRPANRIAS